MHSFVLCWLCSQWLCWIATFLLMSTARGKFSRSHWVPLYNLRLRTSLDVKAVDPVLLSNFPVFQHDWVFFKHCQQKNRIRTSSDLLRIVFTCFYHLACHRRRCRAQDCTRQFAAGSTMTTVDHDYRLAGPTGPSGTRSSHANSLHELNASVASWRQLAVHCGCKNIPPVNHQHVALISVGAIYHSLEVKQDSS